MDFSYFQKINNTYQSKSKQETDLFLLNREVNDSFADTVDYHMVEKNGEMFELIIIKDTDGNTFKKKIKSRPNEYFNLGDYIGWNNQHWIVMAIDPDDKTYNSGYMFLCSFKLRWQNSNRDIIQRWCYMEDFTKYSSGLKGNDTITLSDNQYGITLPIDKDTKMLKRDRRFPVDFDDVAEPEIYVLTNEKRFLSDNQSFGRGSLYTITLSHGTLNKEVDKLVELESGERVWICDYKEPSPTPDIPPNQTVISSIVGRTELYLGRTMNYTVSFLDKDTNEPVDCDFTWNIVSEFSNSITQTIDGNIIKLRVSDEDYIDSSFLLQVIIDEVVYSAMKITVVGLI